MAGTDNRLKMPRFISPGAVEDDRQLRVVLVINHVLWLEGKGGLTNLFLMPSNQI
jgi:hypothetical protein